MKQLSLLPSSGVDEELDAFHKEPWDPSLRCIHKSKLRKATDWKPNAQRVEHQFPLSLSPNREPKK